VISLRKYLIPALIIIAVVAAVGLLFPFREPIQGPEIIYQGVILPVYAVPYTSDEGTTTYIFTQNFNTLQDTELPTISVSASWSIDVETNIVIVSYTVRVRASTASEAVSSVAEKINNIVDKLKSLGIPEDQIYTKRYSLNPVYDYDVSPPKLIGYEAEHTISVEYTDKELAAKSIDEVSSLGVTSISIAFTISKEDFMNAYKEALAAAVSQALEKAQVIANAAKVRLGRIISISEVGYTSIPRTGIALAEAGKGTQFYRAELGITASVTLVIEIIQDYVVEIFQD